MTFLLAPLTALGAFSAACLVAYGHLWPIAALAAWAGLWWVRRAKV